MSNLSKIVIIALLLSMLFIAQCDNPADPPDVNPLLGQYRWIETYGVFAGVHFTPESEGYEVLIRLSDNNQYHYYKEDSTGDTSYISTFFTSREPVWGTADTGDIIYIGRSFRAAYEINSDTLILIETCIDCFYYKYIKLGNI